MRKILLLTTTTLVLAAAASAHAQNAPSAAQLINELTPGAAISTKTRGIEMLPSGGSPAATMPTPSPAAYGEPAPRQAAPEQSASSGAPSANLQVDFASGSAELTPQAVHALDTLGQALTSSQLAAYNFKIVGHTDTVGDAGTNQALSEQRAQAVKSYLESKFSVSDTRLQALGMGETDLLDQTPANTPDLRNRRVEIINLGQ